MDEITEIKRRAGVQTMVTYTVVHPQLTANASFNHPAIYSFKAPDDATALEEFNAERRKMNTWQNDASRLKSGGINYTKVAQLFRYDTGARIDVDRANPKYDPKKPAELQPSVAFK